MSVAKGRTFQSGNSEAIRLPKDIGFGIDVDLTLVRSGDVLTIFPSRPSLSTLIDSLSRLAKPDKIEERDRDPLPEPGGL